MGIPNARRSQCANGQVQEKQQFSSRNWKAMKVTGHTVSAKPGSLWTSLSRMLQKQPSQAARERSGRGFKPWIGLIQVMLGHGTTKAAPRAIFTTAKASMGVTPLCAPRIIVMQNLSRKLAVLNIHRGVV